MLKYLHWSGVASSSPVKDAGVILFLFSLGSHLDCNSLADFLLSFVLSLYWAVSNVLGMFSYPVKLLLPSSKYYIPLMTSN